MIGRKLPLRMRSVARGTRRHLSPLSAAVPRFFVAPADASYSGQ